MSTDVPQDAPAPASGTTASEPPVKVIKRYSNRKLYDTVRSKYVTLDEIARMIKAGDDLQIIDNETKEDLTSVTLTQIIYEEEKRESRMPLAMLRNLIQTRGTTLQDFFDRSVKAPVEKGVEKGIEELAQIREAATRSVTELTERLFSREEREAAAFNRATQTLLDQLQSRIEDRITEVRATVQKAKDTPDGTDPEARATLSRCLDVGAHAQTIRDQLSKVSEQLERLEEAARFEDPPSNPE